MTEKIEWYKEVLELEPNSKVFFPLARLLVEENRRDEAISVLERGLDRHKEYLEARLLLIELLFQSGRMADCDREIAGLSKILTSYAGFWRAWAACLSSSQTEEASALRFLAAQFLCGPISLREALDRGVETIVAEREGREPRDIIVEGRKNVQDSAHSIEKTVSIENSDDHAASDNRTRDKNVAVSSDIADAATPSDATAGAVGEEIVMDTIEKSALADAASTLAEGEAEESAIQDDSGSGEKKKYAAVSGVYDLETGENTGYNVEQEEHGEDADEEETREEHFAIRTRSMADVLASQGDFDGAIDIYRELAAAASPDETEELKGRIVALEERKKRESTKEDAPVSKEKLINILEALAQRVEERVNNPADI